MTPKLTNELATYNDSPSKNNVISHFKAVLSFQKEFYSFLRSLLISFENLIMHLIHINRI